MYMHDPAFPFVQQSQSNSTGEIKTNDGHTGFSKREIAAVMALQGILASSRDYTPTEAAKAAIAFADALAEVLDL